MSSEPWWAQFRREGSERERFLAIACAVLGTGSVCVAYLAPYLLGPDLKVTWGLLFAYLAYSLVNLLTVTIYRTSPLEWRLWVHAAGVVSICLLTLSTGAAQSPFLILYLLALLNAAELWGMRGTLGTSTASAALLLLWPPVLSSLTGRILPFNGEGGSVEGAIALAVCLVIASYLLGFLAEESKRRNINAHVISRLIGNGLPEIGLRATLEGLLQFLCDYFYADQVRLVLRRVAGDDAFLWEVSPAGRTREATVRFSKLPDAERRAYFAALPESVWRAVERRRPPDQVSPRVVGASGRYAAGSKADSSRVTGRFRALHNFGRESTAMRIVGERHTLFADFRSLLAVSFSYQQNWFGRLLVYSAVRGAFHKRDVRLLERLVREVAPAIQYMHDLGRLRSRAQAAERTRLAHELHDGVIQSLMGLEMQTELVRRHAAGDGASLLQEVTRLQELLRKEILDFRERMQIIKPVEVEADQLVKCLGDTVDQFQRDQPISASFVANDQEVSLPPRVCTELVRVLQEALVNIRKHSGARKALVRFGRDNGIWKLVIEDDGCGFGFTGRLSLAELNAAALGPRVIRERLRSIGADLAIESAPGGGARLEISLLPVANERSAQRYQA
jgi:signal transduction histidine kinase